MPRPRRFQQVHTPEEGTSEDIPSSDVITAKLIDLEHRVSQLEQAAEEAPPVDPSSAFKLAALENRVSQLEQSFEEATSVAVPNSPDPSVVSKFVAIENRIKHIEQRLQSDLPQAKATLSTTSSQAEPPPKAEKGFWDGFFWGAFK